MKAVKFDVSMLLMGMHRSGTSALTRVIGLHGFEMPATLLEKNEKNEGGFWESPRINAFNNDLLESFQQNWFSLPPIDPGSLDVAKRVEFAARASGLLSEEFRSGDSIIIKDPRSCRTGWLWLDVLKAHSRRVVVPIAIRNPIEVARSLEKRNGFDLEFGLLVWLRNYLDAEYFSRGAQRAFVGYDALLDDWRSVIRRLAEEIDLPLQIENGRVAELDSFLDAGLRHHRVEHETVLQMLEGHGWVSATYQILHSAGEGQKIGQAEFTQLDAIRQALDASIPAFSQLVSSARLERKKADGLREQFAEVKRELRDAQRAASDIKGLREQIAAQTEAIERWSTTVGVQSQHIDALRIQIADIRESENAAIVEATTAAVRLELARERINELEERAGAQERMIATGETARRELLAKLRDKSDNLVSLKQGHHALAEKYSDLKRKAAERRNDIRLAQLALEQAREDISRLQRAWPQRVHRFVSKILTTMSLGRLRKRWGEKHQLNRHAAILHQSGLFDVEWYRSTYADVRESGVDPLLHYVVNGWKEGREPSAHFSSQAYLRHNPDVAIAGVDPLLHYVEHGRVEGRGPAAIKLQEFDGRPAVSKAFSEAAAHPVYRGTIPASTQLPVRRFSDLYLGDCDNILLLGEAPVAFISPDITWQRREELEASLELFRSLSGETCEAKDRNPSARGRHAKVDGLTNLVDAWFLNEFALRLRWAPLDNNTSSILRGFQYCADAGKYRQVGEAAITHDLDCIDFDLVSPLYPILVVWTDQQNHFLSLAVIVFPSVFRGGLHYAELIASSLGAVPTESLDIVGFLGDLLRRAVSYLDGSRSPMLATLRVDIREADGNEPLFANYVQQWLDRCFGVRLELGAVDVARGDKVNEYLSNRLGRGFRSGRENGGSRGEGAVLTLAGNDVPSLRLLLAFADEFVELVGAACAPYILADRDTGLPQVLISKPPEAAQMFGGVVLSGGNLPSPILLDEEGGRSFALPFAAAIRLSKVKQISLAELFAPVAPSVFPLVTGGEQFDRIWVIIGPDCFGSPHFRQALESLSVQERSDDFSIILAGGASNVPEDVLAHCDAIFPGRYSISGFERVREKRGLALFLNGAIILHDYRTVHVLAGLLGSSSIATASCALIQEQQAKKGWSAKLAFAGYVRLRNLGSDEQLAPLTEGDWIHRDTFPIAAPSTLLWMARMKDLDHACPPDGKAENQNDALVSSPLVGTGRYHVCSSLVSASVFAPEIAGEASAELLSGSRGGACTRFEALSG